MSITVGTDSYLSLADADAYFATRLHGDAWAGASDQTKEAALVTATRTLERQRLKGYKTDETQTLEFPRTYPSAGIKAYNMDLKTSGWVRETEVSTQVKAATCEQALWELEKTSWDKERERLMVSGVKSKSVGGAFESFSGVAPALAPAAKDILRRYLVIAGRLV